MVVAKWWWCSGVGIVAVAVVGTAFVRVAGVIVVVVLYLNL